MYMYVYMCIYVFPSPPSIMDGITCDPCILDHISPSVIYFITRLYTKVHYKKRCSTLQQSSTLRCITRIHTKCNTPQHNAIPRRVQHTTQNILNYENDNIVF